MPFTLVHTVHKMVSLWSEMRGIIGQQGVKVYILKVHMEIGYRV